jgi:ankyrin repeat protein
MSGTPPIRDLARYAVADQNAALTMLKKHPELLTAKNSTGETALHYLVVENHLDGVKFLAEQGADVNTQNNFGGTPLMDAAQLNYGDMCRFLVDHEAKVNVKDIHAETALFRAAAAGAIVILDLLIEAGADVHARNTLDESILEGALLDKRSLNETLPDRRSKVLDILKKHGYNQENI